MKRLPKVFVGLSIALATSLCVAAVPGQRAATVLGSWSLDTSRLPMAPEQRPKSVRFTFNDTGGDKLAVHVDIVYAPGAEVHSASTVTLDGTPAAIENSPEADTVAMKEPAPNVLVMALKKDGVLVSTRIYSVTPDGDSLVETVVYPGDDSSRLMRTNYFTRVR